MGTSASRHRDATTSCFRWRGATGLNVGAGLDSTNHGRKILLEGHDMFAAEQNRRPTGPLSGLHHEDLVEIDQDLSRRRPGSLQHDKVRHFGLLRHDVAKKNPPGCKRTIYREPVKKGRTANLRWSVRVVASTRAPRVGYFLLNPRNVFQTAVAKVWDGSEAHAFLTSATITAVSVPDCACSLAAAT